MCLLASTSITYTRSDAARIARFTYTDRTPSVAVAAGTKRGADTCSLPLLLLYVSKQSLAFIVAWCLLSSVTRRTALLLVPHYFSSESEKCVQGLVNSSTITIVPTKYRYDRINSHVRAANCSALSVR